MLWIPDLVTSVYWCKKNSMSTRTNIWRYEDHVHFWYSTTSVLSSVLNTPHKVYRNVNPLVLPSCSRRNNEIPGSDLLTTITKETTTTICPDTKNGESATTPVSSPPQVVTQTDISALKPDNTRLSAWSVLLAIWFLINTLEIPWFSGRDFIHNSCEMGNMRNAFFEISPFSLAWIKRQRETESLILCAHRMRCLVSRLDLDMIYPKWMCPHSNLIDI